MTFYVDNDFKCHAENDGTMQLAEDSFFDGKCIGFLEGHRYIPAGCTWTRQDGETFHGIMIAPWMEHAVLADMQRAYEEEQLTDMKEALALLGVSV